MGAARHKRETRRKCKAIQTNCCSRDSTTNLTVKSFSSTGTAAAATTDNSFQHPAVATTTRTPGVVSKASRKAQSNSSQANCCKEQKRVELRSLQCHMSISLLMGGASSITQASQEQTQIPHLSRNLKRVR